MDEYANGTNAVVAVIAYTGYDMEDAMVINKMSYERGFGHGSLYLTVTVDLNDFKRRGEPLTFRFGNLRDTGAPPSPPQGAIAEGQDGGHEHLLLCRRHTRLGGSGEASHRKVVRPRGAHTAQHRGLGRYVGAVRRRREHGRVTGGVRP